MTDFLGDILVRKAREVDRRKRHERDGGDASGSPLATPKRSVVDVLRRAPTGPRVIAEIKFRSPSRGQLRRKLPGAAVSIAKQYVSGGASAISVLADGPGFAGSPLDVKRVSESVSVPILFKEFVLDEVQIRLARDVGATYVLLLVRALGRAKLQELINHTRSCGMEPVVEAADAPELELALATSATVIGVNARDLRTFNVDGGVAHRLVESIPRDRIAIYMSGINDAESFRRVARGRADAVLIGEALMRAESPEQTLRELLES